LKVGKLRVERIGKNDEDNAETRKTRRVLRTGSAGRDVGASTSRVGGSDTAVPGRMTFPRLVDRGAEGSLLAKPSGAWPGALREPQARKRRTVRSG